MASRASASDGVNSRSMVSSGVRSSGSGDGLSWRHFQPGVYDPWIGIDHSSRQSPRLFHYSITGFTIESVWCRRLWVGMRWNR
jgi:hypothetical protein